MERLEQLTRSPGGFGLRRHMNRVLRSSALWEALFRGLPGSVAVLLPHYDADGSLQDFEVLAGNGQFQKMTGLPEERLLGARLSEVHPVFGQRTILNRYARALDRDESDEFEQLLPASQRSEEHTSELQSRGHLVCRLLLETKKDRRTALDLAATTSVCDGVQ